MTAAVISDAAAISLSRGADPAERLWMGARAHSESVGRDYTTDGKRRLVPYEVVAAAHHGDARALGHLCAVIHPRLIGFFRYSGLSAVESEDLAGDVVEGVITNLSSLRDLKSFDAWMWSIGRNQLKGWIRTNRRPDRFSPPIPDAAGPEELAVTAADHSRIRSALSMLNKKDRELLWLREVEELSYGEIGGRIGAAAGTVRVACHRARKRLERAYQEETN